MTYFRALLLGSVAATAMIPMAAVAEDSKPLWAAEATMNPDYVAGASSAAPAATSADEAAVPASSDSAASDKPAWAAEATMNPDYVAGASAGATDAASTQPEPASEPAVEEVVTESETVVTGAPAWAAEATMNPDYDPSAVTTAPAEAAPEAAQEAPAAESAPAVEEVVTETETVVTGTPAWAAEATMNPDYDPSATTAAPAPAATPPAAEEVVTESETVVTSPPAWAAEATMNPNYTPAPAGAAPAAAATAAGEQAIETCRDALNAEATAGKLLFAPGSWSLGVPTYKVLDGLAKIAKDCGDVVIEVVGHTDNVGTPASNKTISQLRAEAVVNYLKREGVEVSKLKATGAGEERPAASNDTAEGRRKNRRIEFSVTPR